MASNKVGTNLFTDTGDTGVLVNLTTSSGFAVMAIADTTAHIPSAVDGYTKGCLLINSTTGSLMVNTGSQTSCTFVSVSNVFGV